MKSHKLNNKEALKFIFAGNSVVTFVNSKTGNRFTFKLKQKKDSNLFFVSVLSGSESYTYIGTVIKGNFKHGNKSPISSKAQSVKVFKYVLTNLLTNNLPEFVEVWHEGKCGKCGKKLTVPSSISTGLGPFCLKSISKSQKRDNFLDLIMS
jgi:hypothetical protein